MLDLKTIFAPPHGKRGFLKKFNKGKLVDIGCGNNSPYYVKTSYPEIYYIGVDICDYNQIKPNLADEYILATPDEFSEAIAKTVTGGGGGIDIVISSHNLEHCNDREKTLAVMMNIVKKGGRLFLSFPSEGTARFPSRKGFLNYNDDPTHKYAPPDFDEVINKLKESNFDILFSSRSYKPMMFFVIGLLLEPLSKLTNRVYFSSYGTWSYWGVESIIWAEKR